jgi:poly(A) polymerase
MELKLDAAKWRRRRGIRPILRALGADHGLVRYVGGAVRDELLGLPDHDIDLATRVRPAEVVQRLEAAGIKAVPTGIEHGTVTAVSEGQPIEVTSLRRDVSTDGRRATVAFTDDWQEDAARRDFTINALSADPISGEIFDYFGGLDDIRARRVRFIGEPEARIAEDHLRILRFFRFHARFGAGANDLMALSRERIADELLKLLGLPDPVPTVAIMLSRAILAPVVPEIEPAALPLLSRVIAAEVDAHIESDAVRRLSALLPPDPLLAEKIAARLKLSNRMRKRLACAANRDMGTNPEALAYRAGMECAVDRLLLAGEPAKAAVISGWRIPTLPIGGGTLIARGLAEGPVVARTLQAIEDRWIEAGFPQGDAFERIVAEALDAAR